MYVIHKLVHSIEFATTEMMNIRMNCSKIYSMFFRKTNEMQNSIKKYNLIALRKKLVAKLMTSILKYSPVRNDCFAYFNIFLEILLYCIVCGKSFAENNELFYLFFFFVHFHYEHPTKWNNLVSVDVIKTISFFIILTFG